MVLIINVLAVAQYVEQLTHNMCNRCPTYCEPSVAHNMSQLMRGNKEKKRLHKYTNTSARYC